MKILIIILLISTQIFAQADYTKFVNPLIGTGGHGHTYPGAAAPFGFMQLSPDSRKDGWDGCGGYHDEDSTLFGFSHTHLSGTGVTDLADLLFLPYSKSNPDEKVLFDKKNSIAEPGYYATTLTEDQIKVELTVSQRSGFHRYKFDRKEGDRRLFINLDYRDMLIDVDFEKIDDYTLIGKRISKDWADEQHFYFYIKTQQKIENIDISGNRFYVNFGNDIDQLDIKVGISAVNEKSAEQNLEHEIPHWNFEQLRNETRASWNKELNKIQIETKNLEDKTIFYTALYHSFLNPNIFSDVDGRYRGMDNKIYKTNQFTQYTIFSLWDTFRATHPLFTLTQQDKTTDFIRSFLSIYSSGGKLPMWELHGNYTGCMIGYHSVPVIVDAWMKGNRDFDEEYALQAMVDIAKEDYLGKKRYAKKGFLSTGDEPESVSKTLEYAYNDWCIAIFADSLGNKKIADEFYERALSYRNLYNPESKFMQPRHEGIWSKGFDPAEVNFNFTEANSYQYSLFTPQDISGLIELLGGKDELEAWLDRLFTTKSELSGRHQVDITGLIGQYAHGNEPSHHMAYLYNFTNSPEKTQYYIQKILTEQYWNAPDGLSGNEDCGQMSSWYVLSSMGFYSLTPGLKEYQIGFPLFESVQLNLENGNTFKIKSTKTGNVNKYISYILLNGKKLLTPVLQHADIIAGGELEFVLGDTPNSALQSTPNKIDDNTFLAVPFFTNESISFIDTTTIKVGSADSTVAILFANENKNDAPYSWKSFPEEGITIDRTTRFYIIAKKGNVFSKPLVTTFYARTKDKTIELQTEYSNQYNGGGQDALIDQQLGNENYKSGVWQGFQKEDVVVKIDLLKITKISTVEVRTLSDIKSWIFHSPKVKVWYSKNGKKWKLFDEVQNDIDFTDYQSTIESYIAENKTKARYIKVEVENFGKCPEWHLGAGGDTWLFLDEIIIK